MGDEGIAAAKIAAAKGYDIMYNLGSVRSTIGTGYVESLSIVQDAINEIGHSVKHIRKVTAWPNDLAAVPSYWEFPSPYGPELMQTAIGLYMQTLIDEIPALEEGFDYSAIDYEPSDELIHTEGVPNQWHVLKDGTMTKSVLTNHTYSKAFDFMLPTQPQTTMYGGVVTALHFPGAIGISENPYYPGDYTDYVFDDEIVGLVISSTGAAQEGVIMHAAADILSLWPGRKNFYLREKPLIYG
jgi:hypothetical protein